MSMADKVSPAVRSEIMRRVRSRDTAPELAARRILHAQGLRYRLHCASLPGKPDIVFRKARVAIFVHGCFWHLHGGCANARIPKSRDAYWRAKLYGNRRRDGVIRGELASLGWTVLVVWECELLRPDAVKRRLLRELKPRLARADRRQIGARKLAIPSAKSRRHGALRGRPGLNAGERSADNNCHNIQ
jgi:DNA mismatch endonuclease (patch repair protein)